MIKNNMYRLLSRDSFILLLFIVMSCIPTFFWDNFWKGHDFAYHLNRINGLYSSLSQGSNTLVHLFWGGDIGYAVGPFYPNLFLYPSALLRLLGISPLNSYKFLVILIQIITCLIAYFSFSKIFKNRKFAIIATALYVFSPYRLVDIYTRSAIGESLAMAFLPLIAAGIHGIYNSVNKKAYVWLSLGFSAVCYSHYLSLGMYFLVTLFFVLFNLKKTFQRTIFFSFIKATVLSILICAFPLTMLLYFSNNTLNMSVLASAQDVQDRALLFKDIFLPKHNHIFDTMTFFIGFPLWLGIVAIFIKTKKIAIVYILMAIFCALTQKDIVAFLLETSFERFLLQIQFPWRLLSITTILLCLLSTHVFIEIYKKVRSSFVYKLLLSVILAQGCLQQIGFMHVAPLSGNTSGEPFNFSGAEFAPLGFPSMWDKIPKKLPELSEKITYSSGIVDNFKKDGLNINITVHNTNNSYTELAIPLLYYRQYAVSTLLNGIKKSLNYSQLDNGLMKIDVPPHFIGTIVIRLNINPWYQWISLLISFISFIYTIFVFLQANIKNSTDYRYSVFH